MLKDETTLTLFSPYNSCRLSVVPLISTKTIVTIQLSIFFPILSTNLQVTARKRQLIVILNLLKCHNLIPSNEGVKNIFNGQPTYSNANYSS